MPSESARLPSPKSRKISGGVIWPFSVNLFRTSATCAAARFVSLAAPLASLPACAAGSSQENSKQSRANATIYRRNNMNGPLSPSVAARRREVQSPRLRRRGADGVRPRRRRPAIGNTIPVPDIDHGDRRSEVHELRLGELGRRRGIDLVADVSGEPRQRLGPGQRRALAPGELRRLAPDHDEIDLV